MAWIPTDERFDAKMTVLIENVRHHVEEEEQDFFPKVRKRARPEALADLGQAMETAKQPRRPIPTRAPRHATWQPRSGDVRRSG